MKQLMLLPLLLLAGYALQAQTFAEWFRQKETQKEYLVQQIAALQAYSGTLQQGYALVRQGLQTVHTIKNGDLGLHQDFFSSLKAVNPSIARLSQLQDIIAWQAVVETVLAQTHSLPLLHASERAYLEQVRASMLSGLAADREELRQLLTAGERELSDAARLEKILHLHARAREKLAFTQAYLSDVQGLVQLRARQGIEAKKLQQIHGSPERIRK